MQNTNAQIVYVLTNPVMPGLVKIGMTAQQEVEERMRQLYSTGVLVPFDCAFACKVNDAAEVEKALHYAFGMTRINPSREFFKIEADRVIAVLQLLKVDDITQEVEHTIESNLPASDRQSAEAIKRSMRPPMNFHDLGIPNGSVLISKDGTQQCEVVAEKKVKFMNNISSLTAATRVLLGLPEGTPLQPSPYWSFNGRSVKEIYEDFHSDGEES